MSILDWQRIGVDTRAALPFSSYQTRNSGFLATLHLALVSLIERGPIRTILLCFNQEDILLNFATVYLMPAHLLLRTWLILQEPNKTRVPPCCHVPSPHPTWESWLCRTPIHSIVPLSLCLRCLSIYLTLYSMKIEPRQRFESQGFALNINSWDKHYILATFPSSPLTGPSVIVISLLLEVSSCGSHSLWAFLP